MTSAIISPSTIYLRHKSGATHALSGRRCKKLVKEILAGRGNPEVTSLVASGYTAFLGPDGEDWDFEGLRQALEVK